MRSLIKLKLLSLFCGLSSAAAADLRPNIVLMMVDDMGIGDTSAYLGKSLSERSAPIKLTQVTPNLEAFAKRSIIFVDVHAGGSMCSTSRYSLMTGRFGHRPYLKRQGWLPHGPNLPMIQPELVTLPEMLKANGYETACVGKYHVGMAFDNGKGQPARDYYHQDVDFTKPLLDGPTHQGFDEFLGVPGNIEDALDTEPRILIRDDRWELTDRKQMVMGGWNRHAGKVLADPSWDLTNIGETYLSEVEAILKRKASSRAPFFLYYVPNANHQNLGEEGRYYIPETFQGQPVKGAALLSDGSPAGERGDMVLENDLAFGRVVKLLESLDDPRNPGHKLIDNTIVIFTSDNGPNEGEKVAVNYQSGGLMGKKASITEGGLRIPFLLYWKGRFEGGEINRTHFALTDLFATFAHLLDHPLTENDARDSYNVWDHWTGEAEGDDLRPRLKFCHLGKPYSNDAMSLREGAHKIIINGGLGEPAIGKGAAGAVNVEKYHRLDFDVTESEDFRNPENEVRVRELAEEALRLRNVGHARDLGTAVNRVLLQDDGWHNLRNDLNGEVGFEFQVRQSLSVTQLGMWDDHANDSPIREADEAPTDWITERPSFAGANGRGLAASHAIRLAEGGQIIAEVLLTPEAPGELLGEFRYVPLEGAIKLRSGKTYRLTMTTANRDGDHIHDPASYDGLSPVTHPLVEIVRSVFLEEGREVPIPTWFEASPDYWRHRLPVGPTLKFSE